MSMPGPTADRAAAMLSTMAATFAGVSTICSSAIPFIFMAVKPRSTAPAAAAAMSAGRSPPIQV